MSDETTPPSGPAAGGWAPKPSTRALLTVLAFTLGAAVPVLGAELFTWRLLAASIAGGLTTGLLMVLGLSSAGVRKLVFAGLLFGAIGSSCAHAPDPFVMSGTALVAAQDTYEATATAMDEAMLAGSIDVATYKAFRTFGKRWQQLFPIAGAAWKAADAMEDAASARDSAAMVARLVGELRPYSTRALAVDGGAP